MGYGGMMSFGHAAYLGIGGYAVGVLAQAGIGSGFVQFPVALAASAIYALVIGALVLRTHGLYFIMITLAFAQLFYFVASGLTRLWRRRRDDRSTSAAISAATSISEIRRHFII